MTAPTITSASIASDGVTLTIGFSDPMADMSSTEFGHGFSLTVGGVSRSVTYGSGDGTSTATFTVDSVVYSTEVVTLDYDSVAALYSTDTAELLADVTGFSVTNNSTQAASGDTIVCDTGSYTLTGFTADFDYAAKILAATGSYLLSGLPAALNVAANLLAESGAYLLSGNTFGESYLRAIVGDTGAFLLTGGSAGLIGPSVVMACDTGAYTLTGGDATVVAGSPFICDTGSYLLTGGEGHQSLGVPVSTGSYAVTGVAAESSIEPYLAAEGSLFLLVGYPIAFGFSSSNAAKHHYHHLIKRN